MKYEHERDPPETDGVFITDDGYVLLQQLMSDVHDRQAAIAVALRLTS